MAGPRRIALAALAAIASAPLQALAFAKEASLTGTAMNPVRKVVTLLQQMQQEVTHEGEKEQELYDKFMCYCKNNGGDLSASIEQAGIKIQALSTDTASASEKLALTKEGLKSDQEDRSAAEKSMAEAIALREKEAAAYAKAKADLDVNVAAIEKALVALEKGMAGGFLQTRAAHILQKVAASDSHFSNDEDRQTLLAFLSSTESSQYAPQSGQIVGILKQLRDEMDATRADTVATENAAIKGYDELMAAKKKEKAALSEAIERKSAKIGELGVSIAQMKNDQGNTEEALSADTKFKAELETGCDRKSAEWEERQKTRADELVAIADTIKVLNDDDALELFKKTLPGASSSFVQVHAGAFAVRARALTLVAGALQHVDRSDRMGLDLIALALNGKKIGFDKVIVMIDKMVATLKQEQSDDDHKKEYCSHQLDAADDKKKGLGNKLSDIEAAIASAKDGVATLTEEIAALKSGVSALDKSVAEATEDRKAEHADFSDLMAHNSAAKDVLNFAKNRLNRFYNPKLFKSAPKQELTREERIAVNNGGTPPPTAAPGGIANTGITVLAQISSHAHGAGADAPAPPPETYGAYAAKSEKNTGVISMINLLIKDLDKEMTEAETGEKEAQSSYETMMQDSAAKRAADSKALAGKQGGKADLEVALEGHEEAHASTGNELMATEKYISSLHSECDWLLQYFDARQEARSSEIDALGKAKAVLGGADYSLLQAPPRGFLRATVA